MNESGIPSCGLSRTLAFLRDPALFTAGAGLELGDVYRVRLPGHRLHVVTDPDAVEQILVRKRERFAKGRIYWRELRRTLGDSMGALDGARWAHLHDAQRPFFTPRAVEAYLPTVTELVSETGADLAGRSATGPVPLLTVLSELNAAIVLRSLFGQREGGPPETLSERIADGNRILDWKSRFPWRPALARVNGVERRTREHRAFFDDYVRTLTADPDRGACLLDALAEVLADPDAPSYDESLVRNEVMFHLGASTETLAAAEGWALHLLWRHPSVREAVRGEVDSVSPGEPVSPADLPSLDLTQRVVDEALRLYPPVYGIVRDCVQATDIGLARARVGDTFLISVFGLHRNPRLWARPDAFDPARFGATERDGIGRYAYIPFGAGPHVCTGRHLARSAMSLTVAHMVQSFDWEFTEKDIRPEASPSLKPAGAFRARFRPRG